MSLKQLNKTPALKPEKEIPEEHQGPSKSLEETISIVMNMKLELREVEHFIQRYDDGPEKGVKAQLEQQLLNTKKAMVRLERMLTEVLEAGEEEDAFAG